MAWVTLWREREGGINGKVERAVGKGFIVSKKMLIMTGACVALK